MKNKIFKLTVFSLAVLASLLTSTKVLADWSDLAQQYNFSANACSPGSNTLCFSTVPSPKYNQSNQVEGVRLTVVDKDGNRKSSSIDVIGNSQILNSAAVLSPTTLKIDNSGLTKLSIIGKYTRNEIFNSASGTNIISEGVPVVYYLPTLPKITVQNSNLRSYFGNMFKNDRATFNQILSIMGYFSQNGYREGYYATNPRDFLLVEPLLYLQYHTYGNRPAIFAGFGTATEVYKMLDIIGLKKQPEVFMSAMPKSIFVIDAIRDGVNQNVTAGLHSIQSISTSDWREYFLNIRDESGRAYGVASGHFWLNPDACEGPCCDGSCDDSNSDSCVFSGITSNLSSNCKVSTTGTIADTADWNCIYKQKNAAKNTYAGQFYQDDSTLENNPFCNIACREEITTYYPRNDAMNVYAGHRFTIGGDYLNGTLSFENTENLTVLGPVEVVAVKTCRTALKPSVSDETIKRNDNVVGLATIDVEEFKKRYAASNNNVIKKWDEYQIALLDKKAAESANKRGGTKNGTTSGTCSSSAGLKCYSFTTTCTDGTRLTNPDVCIGPNDPNYSKNSWDSPSIISDRVCTDHYTLSSDASSRTEHHITKYTATATYTDSNGVKHSSTKTAAISDCSNPAHSSLASYSQDAIDNAKRAYDAAVAARDNLLTQLKQCNNYYNTYSDLDPNINFTYLGTVESQYTSTAPLEKKLTSYSVQSVYSGKNGNTTVNRNYTSDASSIYGSSAKINSANCSGESPCKTIQIDYPTNSSVTTSTTVQYDYSLKSDIYRYVDKFGVSKYQLPASETEWAKEYRDIGYPNFPISFETLSGSYDYQINLGINKFGSNNKFTLYSSEFPASKSIETNLDYTCAFSVKNCILQYCPPEGESICRTGCCDKTCGLQVIYRPISLTDPFPYMDGEGRSPGSNWNGPNVVSTYITNNRNVTEYEVYSLKPMYQFILNSANMRAIRSYNNSLSADYNDFNLTCTNGRYCKSEFLQEGIQKGYFKFTNANSDGGVCFNAAADDWESCRIPSESE